MPEWLTALLNPAGGLISTIASFIPNPEEKQKAIAALQSQIIGSYLQADADQRAINKQEAASGSLFVAGARPAIMWLCAFGLAYQWFVIPLLTYIAMIFHWTVTVSVVVGNKMIDQVQFVAPPPIPSNDINALIYALLGLGAYRTVDKAIPGGLTQAITGIFKKG